MGNLDDPKVLAATAAAHAANAADAANRSEAAAAATTLAINGLSGEVRRLRESLETHPTHGQVRRARWVSITVVLTILLASVTFVRHESRQALMAACLERQELEAVLRGILAEAGAHRETGESDREQAHDEKFAEAGIRALTSPPCTSQLENPTPSPSST